MKTRFALLALFWAVPAHAAFQASPAQEDSALMLRLKGAPSKEQPFVRFEGKTLLPNDAVLKGSLFRLDERAVGRRLTVELVDAGRAIAQVAEKKVSLQFPVDRPGRYRLIVEVPEDRQEPALLPAIRALPVAKWTFEGAAWGDAWAGQLVTRLGDLDRFGQEALALVEEFAQAAGSKDVWTDRRPKLEKEADKLIRKWEDAQLSHSYAAAFKEIRDTVRNMRGSAALMQFGEDGKCKGPYNYMTKKPAQTIHQEDFTFARIRKDVEEAATVAGREFCLWLVHDFRRLERRAAVFDGLKSEKRHPGVAEHAASLEKATLVDLEDLEREIRGGPKEKERGDVPKPPSKSGDPRPATERR